ncbi:hypothetical protein GQ53DRAFT_524697 [Thozetella sp. PMI_491]|nr:hypothetical protein GQ53DRAFT_524697 [Thozetella sp. PMI_491]
MDGRDQVAGKHECPICSRRYERLDHLRRHALSHENSRPHACPYCSRRFNRKDILARHLVSHDPSEQIGGSSHSGRAIQACKPCVQSKARCNNQRPCRRCVARHISCQESTPKSVAHAMHADPDPLAGNLSFEPYTFADDLAAQIILQPGESLGQTLHCPTFDGMIRTDYPLSEDISTVGQVPTIGWPTASMVLGPIAPVEEQSLGALDFNLSEMLSSSADASLSIIRAPSTPRASKKESSGWSAIRHEAFKKSLWVWVPSREAAYLDCQHLFVDERQVLQGREAQETSQSPLKLPRITEYGPRDGILSLTVKFAGFQPSVASFPSLSIFNVLMQTFFVKEHSRVDTIVHAATFDPNQCRYELLAAIIGAGSTMFAVSSAQKLGLSLQEIVRRAICSGQLEDNTLTVALQALQTGFLSIEASLWSGVQKKIEIAEGHAHTTPSMIRRAGALRKSYYLPPVVPKFEDQGDELRRKWHTWVEREAFKRLTLRVFVNDMRASISFGRAPILSTSEITFALPASRDLWDAASPELWKARFLAKPAQQKEITIIEAMHDRTLLNENKDFVDVNLAAHAILHALWGRTWLFLESRSLSLQPFANTTSGLLMEMQRKELCKDIQAIVQDFSALKILTPASMLLSEMVLLYLHSSPEDMGRFASRFEADDFDNVLPALEKWLHSGESCRAIWHAGQILRAARLFPPVELGGFYSVAVYQACLTLWVFTVLLERSEKDRDPVRAPIVALDQHETVESRSFLKSGRGCPCINVGGQMTRLDNPRIVSEVMDEIFQENFASKGHPLPLLTEDLYTLIHTLAQDQ